MHILLFVLYAGLLSFAILRIPFFRNSGLKPSVLLLLFALRIGVGCLHNLIAWRYFPNHGDIWVFFQASLDSRHELFTDFHRFVQDNSPWAYLPYNVIILTHLLFNFLSVDNLYINTLLFSFCVFGGAVALFHAFKGLLKTGVSGAATTLLIPSTLFWTACMLKDGVVYLLLGFFFYHLQRGITLGWTIKRVAACAALFLGATFFRGNMLVTLLPALLLWRAVMVRRRVRMIISVLAAAVLILIILLPTLHTGILQYLADRQKEFQSLEGHSRLSLPWLSPTLAGLWQVLPYAALNGCLGPLPGAGGQPIYLAASVELILIWALVLMASGYLIATRPSLRSSLPPGSPAPGFCLCCLFFALSGMLLIGYTIPFAGTIVRYRSVFLPFLLAPALFVLRRFPFFEKLDNGLGRLILRQAPGGTN
ncbi:MAG: hypothetical protein Q8927_03505 [Bacteroidota bacterium]|nr:hypothetical protein [Bacteroidota bacterium]MDP4254718.1 hypothetical protein [Bacteroidota bacterium]MDP4258090.1 hypothetical protein [Bacteroidota bacterium]